MENKTNWGMIIGIVVVVAVIASLVTLQFTGNVVKITPAKVGTDIYTKAEVDSMMKQVNVALSNFTSKSNRTEVMLNNTINVLSNLTQMSNFTIKGNWTNPNNTTVSSCRYYSMKYAELNSTRITGNDICITKGFAEGKTDCTKAGMSQNNITLSCKDMVVSQVNPGWAICC